MLLQTMEILMVINGKEAGCSMRIASYTLNLLDVHQRESGKEIARKSPLRVGTNLKHWPQSLPLQGDRI